MAKITLEYDDHNPIARKTLAYILSIGFSEVKPRKTGLEEALDDVKNGRVTRIYTPQNRKNEKA